MTEVKSHTDSTHANEVLQKRALQVQRGASRAAVLGVNDGLVSVLCLILAVAGSGASQDIVLMSALGGLLSGAISMAAGEWISVKSQVELFDGIIEDFKDLMKTDKAHLSKMLAKSYIDEGYSKVAAVETTKSLAKNDEHFTNHYIQQVIGFNPDELGSPWTAAFSSFGLFIVGAIAPTVAWLFIGGTPAVIVSITLTGIFSLIVGGYIAQSSGKSRVKGAFRQLFIVIFASIVTYLAGVLFGVTAA